MRTSNRFPNVVWIALVALQGCAMLPPRRIVEPLPHFARVDEGFYRGGQPTSDGIQRLAKIGVKTIVSLRHHSRTMDEERNLAEQLGMRWINIPIWPWWPPSHAQLRQFSAIASDPNSRPVFVHCLFGRNRTGLMTAVYRIDHHGWTPKESYLEACQQGLVPWNLLTRSVILHHIRNGRIAPASEPYPGR